MNWHMKYSWNIFYKWIDRSSSPVQYIKNSLQNGIKTSPWNLITRGYEKLTLGLPDTKSISKGESMR